MTKRTKASTHTQTKNFWYSCSYCDYQVIKRGDNNDKVVKKMFCNHLRKTHKFTDEMVCVYLKNQKETTFHGAFALKGLSTNLEQFLKKPDYKLKSTKYNENLK